MILKVYVYRDTQLNAFQNPMFSTDEPDIASESLARAIIKMNNDQKLKFRDLVLYHIGSFDDHTGIFTAINPVALLNCVDYCRDEVISDEGRKENSEQSVQS